MAILLGVFIGGSGSDSDSEICTHKIEDSYSASVVAAEIASTIRLGIAKLPAGAYNEEVLQCNYGNTMTIIGIRSYTIDESCGIDCTITYGNRDIIATLSSCDVNHTDYSVFISGEVNYSAANSNQQ